MAECIKCNHFRVIQQPLKDKLAVWDLGRAVCGKYDLYVDFKSQNKLKKLKCVEDDLRGDNNGTKNA